MKIIDYIKKTIKIINIILNTSYHIIIYKLNFKTYNDTIINICNSLVNQSYIFIKVIQWGIQNVYDLDFDEKVVNYFNTFSNNVPYTTVELEQSILSIHKAVDYASTFCNDTLEIKNNHTPINSGSVALVYKGCLNDKPVIIKVLRCNIIDTIEEDICFLEYFFDNIFIKNIINYYTKINFKNFITINRSILLKQCDFKCEINNALLFKNILKNKKKIVIPHMYEHFTNAFHEIIVMDFIDGPVAKNVEPHQLQNHTETIQLLYFELLFQYNILHGDFHLGNVIIVNENTLGIIDFGIIHEVNHEISNKLFDIILLNLNRTNANISQLIKSVINLVCINEKNRKYIFIKIKNDNELMSLLFDTKFSGSALVGVLNKIIKIDNVYLDNHSINLLFAFLSGLQTVENCTRKYKNDFSASKFIKSYINKIKM